MRLTFLGWILAFTMVQSNAQTSEPDLIFIHGNIYTGANWTERGSAALPHSLTAVAMPRAQALAIRGERIIAVGSDAEINNLKGRHTRVFDLEGHFVMPGFNDAHLHLVSGGFEKLNVDLVGAKSLSEMKNRIATRAKTAAAGEWILGGGWDHTLWPNQNLPTRQDLDAITGDHPAIFTRVDGHIAVANSTALRLAAITGKTPDPAGGKIDHDSSGEPTGILRETAMNLVRSKIPKPSPSQRRRAIELGLEDAAQWGITSAQDNSDWENFLVYEDMEREGKLTLRITEWLPFDEPLAILDKHRALHPQSDMMLHTGMLKGFMDGSLGSRTAALLQPYSDDPKNSGIPRYQQPQLDALTRARAAAGFQIGFHAIGDRGVEMALQAFSEADRYLREHRPQVLSGNTQDHRWRIEHAQIVSAEHFERFRELNVIASMQPNHLLTDMNWAEARLGPERAKRSYAWGEFLNHGVRLAFGTDYPVEPITPFRGLYAAVTRKNEAGSVEYFPEQKLSIDAAIGAYTTGSAYAEFAEKDKGTLARGMLADFVVLDRDITRVPPPEILQTQVLRTVLGGKTVYQAK